jgi:ubiquinone/menaquinone biosynthesis C-methylase UbiE
MTIQSSMKNSAEQALDDGLLGKVLGERNVRKQVVAEYHDDFDRIMSEGETERPWQSFELTQRENVVEWIEEPAKIAKIQPSLRDFRQIARSEFVKAAGEPLRVLDVGCYGGYVFDYLKRYAFPNGEAFHYTGVDIDPNVVKAASFVHSDESNAAFREADLYALDRTFDENSFDIVLCSRVLIHIPRFQDAIAQLYRVCRSAVVTVVVVSETPLLEKIHRENLDNGVELDYYFRKYSEVELVRVADDLGADYRHVRGPSSYSTFVYYKHGAV